MSAFKRFVTVVVLLAGITALSFGEAFYSFTTGLCLLNETYTDEAFGRDQTGGNFNFSFYYFPGKFPIGVMAQSSFSNYTAGYEWNNDEMTSMYNNSAWDFRISAAPSFKLQLGSKVRIPLSLGPAFSLYREENLSGSKNGFYEAINMGLMGDVSIIINPSRWFFLRHGITAGWDFLRAERGQIESNYRAKMSSRFKGVPYSALSGAIYFGIGIRFQ